MSGLFGTTDVKTMNDGRGKLASSLCFVPVARHPSSLRLFRPFLMNTKVQHVVYNGGLFLAESVQMASSFLQSRDWQSTIDVARGRCVLIHETKSMRGRCEIANRLTNPTKINWCSWLRRRRDGSGCNPVAAICRTYRLIESSPWRSSLRNTKPVKSSFRSATRASFTTRERGCLVGRSLRFYDRALLSSRVR